MPQPTSDITRAVVDQVPKAFRLESIKSRIVAICAESLIDPKGSAVVA